MLPAAGCSRNAIWKWKHSKIFHSLLVARSASHHVKSSDHWAEGKGRSLPVRWSCPCWSWQRHPACMEQQCLNPAGVADSKHPCHCPSPTQGDVPTLRGEQNILCVHMASLGERLNIYFSTTQLFKMCGPQTPQFPPPPCFSCNGFQHIF